MKIATKTTRQFLKQENAKLKVTSRNGYERQIWTNGSILVLESPEQVTLPKGNYECIGGNLVSIKSFPDYKGILNQIDKRKYHKAQPDKQEDYTKLWYSDWDKLLMISLTNGDKQCVFINYEYYSYLVNERHTWTISEWKIKGKTDPVLAYCDSILMAVVMPIDFPK